MVGGFVRDMLLAGRGGAFGAVIPGKSERYATRGESVQTGDPLNSCHSGAAYCVQNDFNCYFNAINRSSVVSCALAEDDAGVKDIDLVTPDSLEAFLPTVRQLSENYHITKQYQAVAFSFEGYRVTLTRLRYDALCDGRQAEVGFVDTLQEDVWRRDFTINALYADAEGQVIDFVGGYQDLAAGKIRFIGDPETRIKQDSLRILRYVRFCCLLGTPMDIHMLDLMRSYIPELKSIPHSCLQHEINKIHKLPSGKESLIQLHLSF